MSFRCEICLKPQPPGARPTLVVTKVRNREYSASGGVSLGYETIEEKRSCQACYPTVEPAIEVSAPNPAANVVVDSVLVESGDN